MRISMPAYKARNRWPERGDLQEDRERSDFDPRGQQVKLFLITARARESVYQNFSRSKVHLDQGIGFKLDCKFVLIIVFLTQPNGSTPMTHGLENAEPTGSHSLSAERIPLWKVSFRFENLFNFWALNDLRCWQSGPKSSCKLHSW